jgi:hypothetical protein
VALLARVCRPCNSFQVEGHLLTRSSTNVNLCGRHIERFDLRQHGLFKTKKTEFDISQKSVPRPHPTKNFRHANGRTRNPNVLFQTLHISPSPNTDYSWNLAESSRQNLARYFVRVRTNHSTQPTFPSHLFSHCLPSSPVILLVPWTAGCLAATLR